MKNFFLLFVICFGAVSASAQCYPDRHNTSWFDGWISCEVQENPNALRAKSHWISYDFGQAYALNELKLWNINDPDLLDYGVKILAIDYSLDGEKWNTVGEFNIPKADGVSTYEGSTITDFNGIEARYLLFTIIENYGGTCTGFAEMRVAADSLADPNEDICIVANVYPNPVENMLSVYLQKKCLGDVYLTIEDATGRTVMKESTIALYQTKQVNVSSLKAGVYFVCLRNGDFKQRYKVVKY